VLCFFVVHLFITVIRNGRVMTVIICQSNAESGSKSESESGFCLSPVSVSLGSSSSFRVIESLSLSALARASVRLGGAGAHIAAVAF
jgi:hypothetical protein